MAAAPSKGRPKDSKEGTDDGPKDKNNPSSNTDVEKVRFKVQLEPGKIYEFRVAAVNVAGRGPWSEPSIYKVPEPANLPAPTNITLTATKDGVKVSWEILPNAKSVKEYRAFVSVKSEGDSKNQCEFMPIYIGSKKYFTLYKETIEMAAIDKSAGTPAILLRIVAKSDKGYGPAIHVRCVKNW